MRVRTRFVVAVALVLAGISLGAWTQVRPVIDAGQASSLAMDFKAGTDHSGWRADSATLDSSGAPPPQGNRPGHSLPPKCWGSALPLGDGCLPYPVWLVHLVGHVAGQCSDELVYVDARKARVAESHGQTGPC